MESDWLVSDWLFNAFLAEILGLLLVAAWAVYRWKRIQPELAKADGSKGGVASGAGSQDQGITLGPEAVKRLLAKAGTLFGDDLSPETTAARSAIQRLEASPEAASEILNLIRKALETAEVRSLLLAEGGNYSYIVVTPNRHEHASLLRRYPEFSSGWRHHAEIVRASLKASGDFSGLTTLLFFLSPDHKESAALLSYAGTNSMLLPSSLVESDDLKTAGVRAMDASFEFSWAN